MPGLIETGRYVIANSAFIHWLQHGDGMFQGESVELVSDSGKFIVESRFSGQQQPGVFGIVADKGGHDIDEFGYFLNRRQVRVVDCQNNAHLLVSQLFEKRDQCIDVI